MSDAATPLEPMRSGAESADEFMTVPLFPLGSVLLPDGLLGLQIFEARYLDLMSRCLREGTSFGVVALKSGSEVRRPGEDQLLIERAGCLAELVHCDAHGPGRLVVRCRGTRRFELAGAPSAQSDGLWTAPVRLLPDETPTTVPPELARTALALGEALQQLDEQGIDMHWPPARLDDALWVAYRWCDLLPLANSTKVTLMSLDDPLAKLQTIDHILGQHASGEDMDESAATAASGRPGSATLH